MAPSAILSSLLVLIANRPFLVTPFFRGFRTSVCRPGATVHVLALSDAGRGFGPEVSEEIIRHAFSEGWELESLETTTYRGVVGSAHAEAIGEPVGARVDEPAWLARVRRL